MLIQMFANGQQIHGYELETAPNAASEYSGAVGNAAGVLLPEENWLEADWRQGTLVDLVDHIVYRHHAYARRTLPRLASLMNEVVNQHGDLHPEIIELATTFLDFSSGLLAHMTQEECLLHTRIRELEKTMSEMRAHTHLQETPPARLAELIACMEDDHAVVDGALEHMRYLTHNYTPPAGASAVYRTLLGMLAALDEDMRRHVYKENEVLFPRAVALEESLLPEL